MNQYRVSARFVCDCLICQKEEKTNNFCNGIPFSDEFSADDIDIAVDLAKRKFIMIHDDILDEFEGEEHDYRMEILDCKMLN